MLHHGLAPSLSTIHRCAPGYQSRSLSAENPDGARSGGGRHIDPDHLPSRKHGQGWKVRPCVGIAAGETFELGDITGPGCIQQIWITHFGANRDLILRIWWDDQQHPSVECPLGDFFASAFTGLKSFKPLSSAAVCVNPGNAYNCYWPMPFRSRCRISLENRGVTNMQVFYQVNYVLGEVEDDAAYFHAQFRRVNPLPKGSVYTILDGVTGAGHYVGTYLAWGVNNNGWWGEGEIKFYLDGDTDPALSDGREVAGSTGFPTICGTGTEDYFCGSHNFENNGTRQYEEFCTPYAGLANIVRPDGLYQSNMRFSMYRWHLTDPIRFERDLRVTIQALGWQHGGSYLPLQDDIASVAYWYQQLPSSPFPVLPDHDDCAIN